MVIDIQNCNNIDYGEFIIEEGKLNIKYAINGTGKSTVAHALEYSSKGTLNELRPFKYLDDGIEEHNPNVNISSDIKKISIFDEKYVNSYVFQKEEILKNSFEILVKSEEYDKHMNEINALISAITKAFKEDTEIDKLVSDLQEFEDSFGKAKSGYSKTGDIGKSLTNGNKLIDIPEELGDYTPFLKSENNSISWLKWQAEGKSFIDISDNCPYCVSNIKAVKKTILKVSEDYDAKYLAVLDKVLKIFDSLSYYFNDETREAINGIVLNSNGITKEQVDFLKSVKEETTRLKETLFMLKYMSFSSFKDVDKVIDELQKKIINLSYYPKLKSNYTEEKIRVINESIQTVINTAGKLQGQIVQQKKLIHSTIEKYKKEINEFLCTAGYDYQVDIVPENEKYKLILKFADESDQAIIVNDHLSYGERNALALVLFMYQVLKEETDLIVLDDPISSFDTNKKYAILKMLFMGKDSLRGKTVIMLTHDFEPIIDSIYNMKHYFQPAPVAAFLGNINGVLEEKEITKKDIKSFLEICYDNMKESTDELHKLIYLRRYLEITKLKGLAWQLVSNVFHKNRENPIIKVDDEQPRCMTCDEIKQGENEVRKYIPDFEYSIIYQRVKSVEYLKKVYNDCKSGYEKVQVYRIIFDGSQDNGSALKKYVDATFHVQNDYLFQLNPREYKIVPQYILSFCDSAVNELEVVTV